MHRSVTPPPLSRGDRVAILRTGDGPAKTEYKEVYELGLERLEDVFGLEPVEYPTCDMTSEELREHPEKRADDIMDAFQDDSVTGIIAAIGGDGNQIRVLNHLDGDVLRDNPKRFYGYSDNTSLALYLAHYGVVSYQGPMVMTELAMQGAMHDYTVEHVEKAFFSDSIGTIRPSEQVTDEDLAWGDPENLEKTRELEPHPGWEWHNAGQGMISGRIWGGCLELTELHAQADAYIPTPDEAEGMVLALETSEEVPPLHFVERHLRALGERGILERFEAVLFGFQKARSVFSDEKTTAERNRYREAMQDAVKEQMDWYAPDTPAVFNVNFGHADPIVPLPIGGAVTIDTDEKRIVLE